MNKKLLMTVGAGASIAFGLPSVEDVDALLNRHAARLFPLASDPSSNLYRYCRDVIEHYYATSKPTWRKRVNFEEILYQINLLVPYHSDPMCLHGSNALLAPNRWPDVLEFGASHKAVDGNVLRHMGNALTDALVDQFIDGCAGLTIHKATEIKKLQEWLAALREAFEIGIITLNYDNIFTQACPELYTGFDPATSRFAPLEVLRRDDWNFIYHLHGSIHFAMTGTPHDMHGITWVTTPQKGHQVHSSGRNDQESMEGVAYPTSTIIAGYGKTQQILRQPFRTYYAQVNRLVQEADSLLFLGYGFQDLHLNAAFSDVRDRRRPVVVVDFAGCDQEPLQFRHDSWSNQLFKTLPGDANRMSMPGHRAPVSIAKIKAANDFELSNDPDYPLAVWYNGLLAACQHPDKILAHLR